MRGVAAIVVATTLILSGCVGSIETADPNRLLPLDSPPDPGPVPTSDGFTEREREVLALSTMRIVGIACGQTSEGSGFAIAENLVATNAHVLLGVADPRLKFADGTEIHAVVVAFDADNDLAILRTPEAVLSPLPLGEARAGTEGAVFGWDSGPVIEIVPFRVDRPVTVRIEAVGSDQRISRPSWLIAADIESGDSGAALIDHDGTVIGIAYATTTRADRVGYAVRASVLEDLHAQGFDDELTVPDC